MTKKSKSSLERRMLSSKKAQRFGSISYATLKDGRFPERLRYSRLVGLLPPEPRAEFERDRAKAAHCPKHGDLTDPAVFFVGVGAERRLAFACPWCSGSAIQAAWEKEGAS